MGIELIMAGESREELMQSYVNDVIEGARKKQKHPRKGWKVEGGAEVPADIAGNPVRPVGEKKAGNPTSRSGFPVGRVGVANSWTAEN